MKKIWQKPKLLVLVRCTPEEDVLGFCNKTTNSGPVQALCDNPSACSPISVS